MAGLGGLNITHSEPREPFIARYAERAPELTPIIEDFTPDDLRDWCARLGEGTFVGSSGRVFPDSFKASPLLRAWLTRLEQLGVRLHNRHRWTGWDDSGALRFEAGGGQEVSQQASATVLGLGGATWPRLFDRRVEDGAGRARGAPVSLRPQQLRVRGRLDPASAATGRGKPVKNVGFHFGKHSTRRRRSSHDAGSRAGRSMLSAPQSAMPWRRRRGRKPCASTCCPSGQRRRSRPACPAPQPRRVVKTVWAIACARPSTSIRCSGRCFSRGSLQERAKCSPKTSLRP